MKRGILLVTPGLLEVYEIYSVKAKNHTWRGVSRAMYDFWPELSISELSISRILPTNQG